MRMGKLFSRGRNYFQPVAVRVYDEIDAHRFVFIADASHFFMLGVEPFVVIGVEGEVEFIFAEIVLLGAALNPSKLKLVRGIAAIA